MVKMAMNLWPGDREGEMKELFTKSQSSEKEKNYLYKIEDEYVGFIYLSLRSDYVEGSDSSPVGYIEGIYVGPEYRHQDIARQLVQKGEDWTKSMGCTQMASDCELENTVSYQFHLKVGFEEANRIISFIKDLD
ncbi:MAG: aminoglycoside 6'-N-acetyltransferase [Halanaerobiales bacterium]